MHEEQAATAAAAATPAERLRRLRAQLQRQGVDGFIVPLTDEHMSEYVGAYARRLAFLTGFTGSAGTAVVLPERAALFVDGRYTIQAARETEAALYERCPVPGESIAAWLARHAKEGLRIGYDPWLTTKGFAEQTGAALGARGAHLVALAENPVDAIWAGKPGPSPAPAEPFGEEFAGRRAAAKRRDIATALQKAGADVVVLAALDSIAWAFNIRGQDIHCTPVVQAFALVQADGRARLFLDPRKVTDELRAHLGADVAIEPYADFGAALVALSGRVLVDPQSAVAAIFAALRQGGATVIEGRDPCLLPKAAKNETELRGMRGAHLSDGLALTRFLASIDRDPPEDEIAAARRLEGFRRQSELLRDLSFDSISALGPNSALPHYHTGPATNRPFAGEAIYLIDSGGQYQDGTTDVTRTVAVGPVTAEMRQRNTLVLQGHIALACARFPKGTRGGQLDALARQFLWQHGLDYQHGTGHGVGHYLAVHEGPQRIASSGASGVDEPLLPGMVLSNEPGYYKEGFYGIRIENLVIVVEDERPGDERPMLALETITLAPIDKRLIEPALLTAAEAAWLDRYHEKVRNALAPALAGAELSWLEQATAPLAGR